MQHDKPTDWDKAYSHVAVRKLPEPEPAHWLWQVVGMALGMLLISWLGAWIAEGLS